MSLLYKDGVFNVCFLLFYISSLLIFIMLLFYMKMSFMLLTFMLKVKKAESSELNNDYENAFKSIKSVLQDKAHNQR